MGWGDNYPPDYEEPWVSYDDEEELWVAHGGSVGPDSYYLDEDLTILHRVRGPAEVSSYSNSKYNSYWLYGELLSKEEFDKKVAMMEPFL